VMDTWATSSLSPQIACGWEDDPDLFERLFPMDLRPQAHEIIRTWLFSTVVRSHYEHGCLPWRNAAISGFIVDPDRKKFSKSAANAADDPMDIIDTYGADAVRYWAAQGRPGMDMTFDEGQLKIGRRLAIKLLNASRFALGFIPEGFTVDPAAVTEPLDRSMLAGLARLVDEATRAFEGFDYARALERTETWFWSFCDDYVELVKGRAYGDGPGAVSAATALALALETALKLFAPFLPFAAEEVWSWWREDEGSIHRSAWPSADPLAIAAAGAGADVLAATSWALGEIRKAKTEAKRSMRTEVTRAVVRDAADRVAALRQAAGDLAEAGRVADLVIDEGEPSVEVELAPVD
jgi:valyl-tRNA synthetase